jgi:hypothetical protein
MIMKKYFTLSLATIALGLSACTTINSSVQNNTQSSMSSIDYMSVVSSSSAGADMKDLYRYYESKELGVSLYVPAYFAFPRTITGGVMQFNDHNIAYDSFAILDSDTAGEAGYISITKTNNPQILNALAQYHPLENVSIGGIKMQKYLIDGIANPEGFIQKIKGGYFIVEFTFIPKDSDVERVMESIRTLQ